VKPKTMKVFEWFLVVEGRGQFPVDMLRYDSAFPHREEDSAMCKPEHRERRRVVLCRRGVNESSGSAARWSSFGWAVVLASTDAGEAVAAARELDDKGAAP
jgi:hypothetical protein